MIVVDTSVWIGQMRGIDSAPVRRLRNLETLDSVIVGDLVLMELLQGARDEHHASRIERNMRAFSVRPMLGEAVAIAAAKHFRMLRALGITVRKSADLIIGTYCILEGHRLLHDDRDFDPLEQHLGLTIA